MNHYLPLSLSIVHFNKIINYCIGMVAYTISTLTHGFVNIFH